MAKRAFNVTLPPDLAEMVQDKVASDSYASESEVVSAGLRALERQERDGAETEEWLRRRVVQSLADPRPSQPAEEVFARLRAHHAAQ
ncbi:type II toxin-antitoxin system ParD family antitoxin [Xanthobacteraceae bacterium Astr-EGSB]|uniref:type II toxin-antitoxin system ParD family antitoxin n=1 Tax=Astrobacterium formosum TaxID=3069710 RepID=UPI0027B3CC9C|nr:type II toxin-antitoxin system ParD family antitoxin [Xanthobacteraceae bacterium Astr-EGSB]